MKYPVKLTHASPNYSARQNTPVDLIVLHSTAGSMHGALSWLCNQQSRVSAHYLIARDGTIYKLVPTKYAAWHAGKSTVPKPNLRSIGIELEQLYPQPPTDEQIDALHQLVTVLKAYIPGVRYLAGHKEINKRKQDPWGVDMNALRDRFGLGEVPGG